MKAVSTLFLGSLLSLCLTLYGSFGVGQPWMGPAWGEAVFMVELCADGGATTIQMDADGNPVEPASNCPECLTCCQAVAAIVRVTCPALPPIVFAETVPNHLPARFPVSSKRHIFAAPRGPPAVLATQVVQAGLVLARHPEFGQITRSGGRLSFKDAYA